MTDEWITKVCDVHIRAVEYLSFQKEKILSCTSTWSNLEDIIWSEKPQIGGQILHNITHMRL